MLKCAHDLQYVHTYIRCWCICDSAAWVLHCAVHESLVQEVAELNTAVEALEKQLATHMQVFEELKIEEGRLEEEVLLSAYFHVSIFSCPFIFMYAFLRVGYYSWPHVRIRVFVKAFGVSCSYYPHVVLCAVCMCALRDCVSVLPGAQCRVRRCALSPSSPSRS